MSLFQVYYDTSPGGHWIFLLVTVIMGGSTAYVSGKAIAETWRPAWHAIAYVLIIGLAVRFVHFALFHEVLVSGRNYLIDCAVLLIAAVIGYRLARSRQMAQQYSVLQSGRDGA